MKRAIASIENVLYILIGMVILISNLIDASLASLGNPRWPPKSKMAAKKQGKLVELFLNKKNILKG